jgi:membrane glycosyltransferase
MTLPVKKQSDDPPFGLQGRARVVFGSSRRQFVHVWTAPRSPVARVVVVPLLLLATLLILAVGLLALLAVVAIALMVAFFALLFGRPLAAIRGRNGPPAARPPGA